MCTRMGALWQIGPGQTKQTQLPLELLTRSTRPGDVERPRLVARLSQLLYAGSEPPYDVATGERGLHSRGRQATFKITEHSAGGDACDDPQLVELRIAHHQN